MIRWIALTAICLLAACNTPEGTARLPVSTSAGIALVGTMLAAERAQAGTSPVTQNAALQAAAQAHAEDLAARSTLSHTGSDGSSLSDRIARTGYGACFAAENIARGQPSIEAVMTSWRNSPGHYANMVNASARHYGFARAGDAWVLVLARPC